MHRTSTRIGPFQWVFTIALLLMSVPTTSMGQLNSGTNGIALVARLESLAVAAVVPDQLQATGVEGYAHSHERVSIRTSWAVPPNRTTIRIVEGDRIIFAQASEGSNRPVTRIVEFDLPDGAETGPSSGSEHRRVIIVVEAL